VATVTGVGLPMLKIAALIFSGGTLLALYVVARRFFGRGAGLLAALAYVAGPPLVAFWGVCLMGFHSESVLPSLLLTHLTLSLVAERERNARAWLGVGLLVGLNLWFTPIAAIAVAACGLTLLALRGVPRPRELAWGAAGATIGLLPWLAYNVTHEWAGIGRVLELFGLRPARDLFRSQSLWPRTVELLTRTPTEGLLDPAGELVGSVWRPLLFAAVLLPAAAALIASARRTLRALAGPRWRGGVDDPARLELVFWLYLVLFSVGYLVSRFTLELDPRPIAFRLLVPPAVFAIVLVAISGGHWLAARGKRRMVGGLAAGVALMALAASTATLAVRHEVEGGAPERSLGYLVLGRLAQRKYPRPIERALAEVRPVQRQQDRAYARFGIGWGLVEDYEQGGSLDELRSTLARLPELERGQVRQGVRMGIEFRLGVLTPAVARTGNPDLVRSERRLRELLRELGEPMRQSPAGLGARLQPWSSRSPATERLHQ
ncbi:MAG: glycosyltransferase family 39 protein, partial [Myxococcota bacterium]